MRASGPVCTHQIRYILYLQNCGIQCTLKVAFKHPKVANKVQKLAF